MFTIASSGVAVSLGVPRFSPASAALLSHTLDPSKCRKAPLLAPLSITTKLLQCAKVNNRQGRASPFMASASAAQPSTEEAAAEAAEAEMWNRIRTHQKSAPRLSPAEETRTLLDRSKRAVLSTFSKKYEGFPFGSPLSFATDEQGRPILSISSLSPHTKDLDNNASCSLLVCKNMADMTDTVVTLIGKATLVPPEDEAAARAAFLKRHPDAFWVDFGDFKFLRIEPTTVRHVENVATGIGAAATEVPGEEYKAAQPDFIAPFAGPISKHMNKDHSDATLAISQHAVGVKFDSASIVGIDKMGMHVEVLAKGSRIRLRIPFAKPAQKREDVKNFLVEMSKEAASAQQVVQGESP